MMRVQPNARHYRAMCALVVALCLVAFMFVTHKQERALHYSLTLKISSLYWNISELFYESNLTVERLRQYERGEASIKEMQDRIDMLWSRLNAFERTHISLTQKLIVEFNRLQLWLEMAESEFFAGAAPTAESTAQLGDKLTAIAGQIRSTWIDTYLADRQGIAWAMLNRIETRADMFTHLTLGCIALLVLYLIAELHFAHKAQLEESKLREAALEGGRAKTRFLSRISHEIRTPLNGIVGMAEDLETTKLTPEQQLSIEVIKDASAALLSMINNVFEIAALETGKSPLRSIPVDIKGIMTLALEEYRPQAEEKFIRFNAVPPGGDIAVVISDPERLISIFGHILAAAIKYCKNTELAVSLQVRRDDTDELMLVFQVEQCTHQAREALIDKDMLSAEGIEDTAFEPEIPGLDLALASQLCRIMNGRMSRNPISEGCYNVTCELPVKLAEPGELTGPSGLSVSVAHPNTLPGTQVAAQIGGRRRDMAALLPKPQNEEAKTLKVLIVDDSPTNRLVLRKFLQDAGVQLSEVDDGAKAVSDCEQQFYDVVLMDIQMPVLNGIEATRRIREMEQSSDRPKSKIMAVTANVLPQQIDEYIKVGMDDVLAKPLNKHILVSRLRALVERERDTGEVTKIGLPEKTAS